MPGTWTHLHMPAGADVAARHGFGELQEARFPTAELGCESIGLGLVQIKPGRRQPFAHRHSQGEEVYVVLAGSGRAKLDDELVEVGRLDAIRVSAPVTRAFEAGEEGLELLVFGPRHVGDGEMLPAEGFWGD